MRIAASPESVPPSLRTPGRGGGTMTSFAQLLERGVQARSVMSHRALGFSETGVLGVHFAHQQGSLLLPTAPASEDVVRSASLPTAERGRSQEDMTAAPKGAAVPNPKGHGGLLGQRSGTEPFPVHPASNRGTPPATISDSVATVGAFEQVAPEELHLGPVRPPAPPPTQRRSPFRVRLLGDTAELVVVLEGARWGDESILELEATARAVASEYCMVISHLFVKPNDTGTAA